MMLFGCQSHPNSVMPLAHKEPHPLPRVIRPDADLTVSDTTTSPSRLGSVPPLPRDADVQQVSLNQGIKTPKSHAPKLTSPDTTGSGASVRNQVQQSSLNLTDLGQVSPEVKRVLEIYQRADERQKGIHNYIVRLKRREVIGDRALPEDLLLCQYQSEPFRVYMKALEGSPTAGREVVYVDGKYNNMMQIRTGRGDIMPGIRLELSPNSPRAQLNCRRTIDESGFSHIIERFGKAIARDQQTSTDADSLKYMGQVNRPEATYPYDMVLQNIPPSQEKHLPQGGHRYWYFCADPKATEYGLPTLIVTLDHTKREVEYYFHDRMVVNVQLSESDFDPEQLWASR